MSGQSRAAAAGIGILLLFALCISAGCVTTTVGTAVYENQSVRTTIHYEGVQPDARVQVTAYRINGLGQELYGDRVVPVSLIPGDNQVSVPLELTPGNYKLFIYILENNNRSAAVIRDIVV